MDKNIGRLGFGAMRLPEKGGQVDLPQTSAMVDMFLDQGFNYFDTAYVYHGGKSETALRDALVGRHPRDKFFLATKMPVWSTRTLKDGEKIFEDQLKKCGVDYFDFYLLHAMGRSREAAAVNAGLYELCQRLKKEGKARYTGFSFHDEPAALEELLVSHPETDFVQLQINYLDVFRGSSGKLHEIALAHNKPVIVMEPVKGGTLAKLEAPVEKILKSRDKDASLASWAIRYCCSLPGILTTLSGMSNIAQVEDNLKTCKDFVPLTADDIKALEEVADAIAKIGTIPCTDCKYCVDHCPKKINIPNLFGLYNKVRESGSIAQQAADYQKVPKKNRASACVKCGACESHCPQKIKIPVEMERVAAVLE
jgi:predicted aldo/keto reductase-like oxidoreductase